MEAECVHMAFALNYFNLNYLNRYHLIKIDAP